MEKKFNIELKIDRDFKNLIPPLARSEYLQLEENILQDGCREPIIVWNGCIVDGHNRYEICRRHEIPFKIKGIVFECREEAIAWICANQLGRRNISDETRKFLIGMQYESEKVVARVKNTYGSNQYSKKGTKDAKSGGEDRPEDPAWRHKTAIRIAEENHISHGTVQRYAEFTRLLETIGKKAPEVVPEILSGRYKISHRNLADLAELPEVELKKVMLRLEQQQKPYIKYSNSRHEIDGHVPGSADKPSTPAPSVKDMPAYDPDAEITGLTLTIPSWASSIERTKLKSDPKLVSNQAKQKLGKALKELSARIDEMLTVIEEE